jgi:DNA-binding XRE family transcriptional regulator
VHALQARYKSERRSAFSTFSKDFRDAVSKGTTALQSVIIQTGRAIAQERRAQGLTQYELARLAGVSRSRLANIETGRFALKSPAAARRYDRDVQKLIRTLALSVFKDF